MEFYGKSKIVIVKGNCWAIIQHQDINSQCYYIGKQDTLNKKDQDRTLSGPYQQQTLQDQDQVWTPRRKPMTKYLDLYFGFYFFLKKIQNPLEHKIN